MISIQSGPNSGGREAIERLLKAYGFTTKQALADHLKISKSTMANRNLRDSFPAEWVIQCALETGASLLWLATGQGEMVTAEEHEESHESKSPVTVRPLSKIVAPTLKQIELRNGELKEEGEIFMDSSLLDGEPATSLFIKTQSDCFVVDTSVKQISNGYWLVDMDGIKSVVKIVRIPGNKIVVHQEEASFECSLDDIETIGRAVKVIKSL
ncbi:phage repressor protein CI [Siccibacter turicensis]|uniref:Phage repressor protein n=1 Tax=Siccibacter turicensis TaxID=357233 RepID=A0A2P8VLX5_9ENTR|nr:phage repressor protein CI [Siccibacter turicensis]PSN08554.1 phage repressor protein [Siccibacter turicensis]